MLCATTVLRRTSRRGPGGWSTPSLSILGRSVAERRSSQAEGPVDHRRVKPQTASASRDAQHAAAIDASSRPPTKLYSFLSSASLYDAGDNPQQRAGEEGSATNNWRSDRRFSAVPSFYREASMRGKSFSGDSGGTAGSPSGGTQSARRVDHDPQVRSDRIREESSDNVAGPNWLGGKGHRDSAASPFMSHRRGEDNFSMIDREQITLTRMMKMMVDATFQPRNSDSRVFGGDNQSKLMEQREELKNMDSRLVPFAHEDLMNDYLKNIQQIRSPSGQLMPREMLRGRLVGLLFFTESDRCVRFMRSLKVFHKKHSPDFVVVAVSLGGKEMLDITRGFGFFQVTHRDGATWVTRDAGVMVRPFTPMPRLVVVDGTSGHEVSRSGVTAVTVHPDTAFAAWKRGESGIGQWDWLKTAAL